MSDAESALTQAESDLTEAQQTISELEELIEQLGGPGPPLQNQGNGNGVPASGNNKP